MANGEGHINAAGSAGVHDNEPHTSNIAGRLNWLRAGVLGANDGIVSVAATVVGVAGVTNAPAPILVAGVAAVVGGAVSMALGEYVSVSSQRDSQRALIEKERRELEQDPDSELAELTGLYMAKGLSPITAGQVAEELTKHDALAAHLSTELNIDQDDQASPWQAAYASAAAFAVGAVLPLLAIMVPPAGLRIPVTFLAVLIALALTGTLSAGIGGSSKSTAATRLVLGGGLALAATYGIGRALGASGIL
ncbi:VIT1/CCC1 family predicted Fe2+/Mn2+ transporter [Arthrobacter silviterrae]|uniref:VIT family protein n=1 Tax=Arthrobacter silviterrae TaxID=2026658 RepID=A0ABX0DER1_9MICC|nr:MULTISPECIES: VIT family protein [Arthrobacter]MCU6482092.1 VIT family protein [Arthrobacter sp. A2-55]MDQ0275966.1 VIT1/CCC1 family predicted Fe2+/Mn2+ transporter [Arthrobacter silviterrae]NGN84216.1 VIT family protein [Arthrobacter silviterrae]